MQSRSSLCVSCGEQETGRPINYVKQDNPLRSRADVETQRKDVAMIIQSLLDPVSSASPRLPSVARINVTVVSANRNTSHHLARYI